MKEEKQRDFNTDGTNNRQRLQSGVMDDDVKEKDINDMVLSGKTKEEVQTIIKNNTYQGNMSKIRFSKWRKINA